MNTYEVKQVAHVPDGMPSWAVYQVCPHGHKTALCLCYTEETANTIVSMFALAVTLAQLDDDELAELAEHTED